jgi:hypothetical protein
VDRAPVDHLPRDKTRIDIRIDPGFFIGLINVPMMELRSTWANQ